MRYGARAADIPELVLLDLLRARCEHGSSSFKSGHERHPMR